MILVTGSTGMIGRALVSRLASEGVKVRAHARSTLALESLFPKPINILPAIQRIDLPDSEIEKAVADIATLTEQEARALCDGCSTVVHTAGIVHQPEANDELYERTNVRATQLLADAARAAGVERFIFLSSSSVYGNRATDMIEETANLNGDTPYAKSKIVSEQRLGADQPAPSTVILRPSLVFGEGDRGNMLSLIRQISGGKYFIVGDGAAQKSLIYAADVARAISLMLKSPGRQFEIFNLANPKPVTVKELSEAIMSASGKDRSLISLPSWFIAATATVANGILGKRSPLSPDRLAKLTRNNSIAVDAFQKAYAFKPEYELESALKNEIEWWRQSLNQ